MKLKYLVIAAIVMILAGAAIGLKMFFKPHADVSKMKADLNVEASVLISEFETDESAATLKYGEKNLEITGKLVSKSKLAQGAEVLVLENEMQGISCQLDSAWASENRILVESVQAGQQITVKGICKGYLMEVKVSPAVIVQ